MKSRGQHRPPVVHTLQKLPWASQGETYVALPGLGQPGGLAVEPIT
jgi:hypothetical protein